MVHRTTQISQSQPPLTTKGSGDLGLVSSHKDPTPIGDAGCQWEWPPTDATPRDITLEGLPPPSPSLFLETTIKQKYKAQSNLVCAAYSEIFKYSIHLNSSGARFNIKMSYQYRKSNCGDKTVVRSSYLHNGISYTGKMSSLHCIGALVPTHMSLETIKRNLWTKHVWLWFIHISNTTINHSRGVWHPHLSAISRYSKSNKNAHILVFLFCDYNPGM